MKIVHNKAGLRQGLIVSSIAFLLALVTTIQTCLGGVSYTYDSLNRLTKADYGGGLEISYTYDASGNRLTYSDIDTTPYVDTTVVAWGDNSSGQTNVPAGLNNVVAVAAGWDHNLALRADGTVVAWDGNYFGQATVPAGLNNVVAVAAAGAVSESAPYSCTVAGWGYNGYGQTIVPTGLSNVVAVAARQG